MDSRGGCLSKYCSVGAMGAKKYGQTRLSVEAGSRPKKGRLEERWWKRERNEMLLEKGGVFKGNGSYS